MNFVFEKKFRSTSKEDTDLFCVWKKFKSASKEDTYQFCVWKKGLMIINRFWNQRKKIKTDNQLKNISKKISTKYLSVKGHLWEFK